MPYVRYDTWFSILSSKTYLIRIFLNVMESNLTTGLWISINEFFEA